MGRAALLAGDWGTTHLRAWALDEQGVVIAARDFPLGVSRLGPGEAARRFLDEVRPALADEATPALLCGMIGSNLGWITAPYVDLPAGLPDLAAVLVRADAAGGAVRIVPGVQSSGFSGQGDVMRGEETQLFGWLAGAPERRRGRRIVCHPGTHTKWMVVQDGRLLSFVTAMTGELFAVLSRHSVLRFDGAQDNPGEMDESAFDEGLAASGDGGGLAARLFTARARVVGRGRPAEGTASYVSGLLIGADVAGTPPLLGVGPTETVAVLGDDRLCALYARALNSRGVRTEIFDGEAAAVAGLWALQQTERRP